MKPNERRRLGLLLLIVAGITLANPRVRYALVSLLDYPFHYKEYKHFGIRLPTGFAVHGIDVSRYQARVDWERVRQMEVDGVRIRFAFIKATEGSWMKDREFERNWTQAKKNGIIRGAYHYFLPDIDPRAQARHFIKTVALRSGDLPPVIDVEESRGMSRQQVRKFTKDFLTMLEKQFKVRPILYTNRDFYKNHFAGEESFEGYPYWIAHYHVTDLDLPGNDAWYFWQHSDKGTVNGINEPVDFNVFNGDSAALQQMCLP